MLPRQFIFWSGPGAMLGGLLWIAGAVMTALKPEGCIAAECDLPGRSMREGNTIDGVLFIAAVLLIGLGVAGVVVRARRVQGFGRLGGIGLVASLAGAALLVSASLVQAFLFQGDFPYMPLFVIPGGVAVVIGMLSLGIAVLRAGVLPRWAAAILIIGALGMLGFNDQNAQALMAIPFGVAWLAAACALWSEQRDRGDRKLSAG